MGLDPTPFILGAIAVLMIGAGVVLTTLRYQWCRSRETTLEGTVRLVLDRPQRSAHPIPTNGEVRT